MTMPIPVTVAFACSTMVAKPVAASPLAKKSSMISTWSSLWRKFLETIILLLSLLVKE
jgi:hypothetical protein